MTIDEYLNQIRSARRRSQDLYQKANILRARLEDLQSSLYSVDRVPFRGSFKNKREELLAEWSDTVKASKEADRTYFTVKNQTTECMYMLPYLEGSIIDQFLHNIFFDRSDLFGLNDILNTDDEDVIISKLNAAKQHLRALLIDKGVEID